MPPNQFLIVGAGDAYRPAESCPVASEKYGNGEYMAHQGAVNSFLVADARVKDGTAGVHLLALWKCSFCGTTLVGLGVPDEALDLQAFTWLERADE